MLRSSSSPSHMLWIFAIIMILILFLLRTCESCVVCNFFGACISQFLLRTQIFLRYRQNVTSLRENDSNFKSLFSYWMFLIRFRIQAHSGSQALVTAVYNVYNTVGCWPQFNWKNCYCEFKILLEQETERERETQ